jgi:FkbM family methyltransferase
MSGGAFRLGRAFPIVAGRLVGPHKITRMPLSLRRRRFLRRLAGYATNPAARRARVLMHREQHHTVAGLPLVLPPDHDLPFYQRRDPTYNAYAERLVAALGAGVERMLVVDLGANVGDTAVACLGAAPNVDVIAVEGSPAFLPWLERNTRAYGDRCRVVPSFVGPVAGVTDRGYITTGSSTGRFARAVESGESVDAFVSPADLLAGADGYEQVTWKSDIDGLDIHVLVQHWDVIDGRCDTLWFEFDPPSTLGDPDDVGRLIDLLAASGRRVEAYDNLGRRIVTLEPGPAVATGLRSLVQWLGEQRQGHVTVPYLDLWAFSGTSQRATQ